WRDEHGPFRSRRTLLEVPGVGPATFTQAAGFLKIAGGDEPLDGTWIHPESYDAARRLLETLSIPVAALAAGDGSVRQRLSAAHAETIAGELGIGVLTCRDILDALLRPGRDPRAELPGLVFRRGVLKLDDLSEGLELTGTVLNVVDFGAFVDVGLKDSALVHVSEMAERYVASPHEMVAIGDVLRVWVLRVDRERRRVSLTMRAPETASRQPEAPPAPHWDALAQPVSHLRGFDELKNLWDERIV
ncbi:MAG: S1 RNA-binding domain-containing protein, partial [Planctomycetes bacterium]|nr:S1 RNA-binding domain-containing protein [Planctomycetota bacterium]